MNSSLFTRRSALQSLGCGFGYLALAGLAAQDRARAALPANPLAPKAPPFKPRAKRIIFLFMQGGVSHVDSFDYKPRLIEDDGRMLDFLGERMAGITPVDERQKMFGLANEYINKQVGWAQSQNDQKHLDRYVKLRAYFESRRDLWS